MRRRECHGCVVAGANTRSMRIPPSTAMLARCVDRPQRSCLAANPFYIIQANSAVARQTAALAHHIVAAVCLPALAVAP